MVMSAVADIGGQTTDPVTIFVRDQLKIDHSRSGSHEVGVLKAYDRANELIASLLAEHLGRSMQDVPSWMMKSAFDTGEIKLNGQSVNGVEEAVEIAKQETFNLIYKVVNTTLQGADNYQVLIFAGGGAQFFKDQILEKFPFAIILDEFANAKGMLKSMLFVEA